MSLKFFVLQSLVFLKKTFKIQNSKQIGQRIPDISKGHTNILIDRYPIGDELFINT